MKKLTILSNRKIFKYVNHNLKEHKNKYSTASFFNFFFLGLAKKKGQKNGKHK